MASPFDVQDTEVAGVNFQRTKQSQWEARPSSAGGMRGTHLAARQALLEGRGIRPWTSLSSRERWKSAAQQRTQFRNYKGTTAGVTDDGLGTESPSAQPDLRWSQDTPCFASRRPLSSPVPTPPIPGAPRPASYRRPLSCSTFETLPEGLDDFLNSELALVSAESQTLSIHSVAEARFEVLVANEEEMRVQNSTEERSFHLRICQQHAEYVAAALKGSDCSALVFHFQKTGREATPDSTLVHEALKDSAGGSFLSGALFPETAAYLKLTRECEGLVDDASSLGAVTVRKTSPSPREYIARLWWAEDVCRQGFPLQARSLKDLLTDDILFRKCRYEVAAIEAHEFAARAKLNELSEFILQMVLDEKDKQHLDLTSGYNAALLNNEACERAAIDYSESLHRNLFVQWRQLEGLKNDEEDLRLDLIEDEENEWETTRRVEQTMRPRLRKCHIAVGSDRPICTVCGFNLHTRFCAATGEPHAATAVCYVCGLQRSSNKFCAATGERHDSLYTVASNEGTQLPLRFVGKSMGVRRMAEDTIGLALTQGLEQGRWYDEIKQMMAPKMVMDLCMELHSSTGVALYHVDLVYKKTMQTLGAAVDYGMLPSTIDVPSASMPKCEPRKTKTTEAADDSRSVAPSSKTYTSAHSAKSKGASSRSKKHPRQRQR
ncbi:hypothetical protein DIPPA_54188 [Diplonema papillatum]|nr:hypothetical protein DIPPA_54188 [Diplonema papillatum]KAJ9456824.1 hypothetical protein DIPPA_54188 [Diplonema papillatum]